MTLTALDPQRNAQVVVARMKKEGRLVNPHLCIECGVGQSEGHHPDYSQPEWVLWLCRRCHKRIHPGKKGSLFTSLDYVHMIRSTAPYDEMMQALHELRDKGWSYTEIGKAWGVSQVAVISWWIGNRGSTRLTVDLLNQCVELLDVPPRVHRGGRPRKSPPGTSQVAV